MKIIVLNLLLLILISCSQESFNDEASPTSKTAPQLDRDYIMKEVSMACELGCMYHYDIYSSANQIVKNAVSLTKSQLESIQKECNNYCINAVFIKINQKNNQNEFKNIKIEAKKQEDIKPLIEKEKEFKPREKKAEDDELTPFEVL
jgi:hypothetical protein